MIFGIIKREKSLTIAKYIGNNLSCKIDRLVHYFVFISVILYYIWVIRFNIDVIFNSHQKASLGLKKADNWKQSKWPVIFWQRLKIQES